MTAGTWEQRGIARALRLPKIQVTRDAAVLAAAVLSAGAGIAHAAAVPGHIADWPLAGAFFVALAAAQLAFAVVLLRDPSRAFLAGAGAGTIGILGLYGLSRTTGLPFGPEAWRPEPAGALDLTCAALEIALLFAIARVARTDPEPRRAAVAPTRVAASGFALAIAAAGTALAAPGHVHAVTPHAAATADHAGETAHRLSSQGHGGGHPGARAGAHRKPTHPHVEDRCRIENATPTTLSPNADPARLTAVATTDHHGNLVVYDAIADTSTTVLEPGNWCTQHEQFRDPQTLTFIGETAANRDDIYMLDLPSGSITKLEGTHQVVDYAWSPDGATLAVLEWTGDWDSLQVSTLDPATGAVEIVRGFTGTAPGRCGWEGDEARISWSPDGTSLLVTETGFDSDPAGTVFAFGLDGEDLVGPITGTFARWLPDSRSFVYQRLEFMRSDAKDAVEKRWRVVDTRTGNERVLDPEGWRFTPIMSRDGATLLFQYAEEEGAEVRALDLASGTERTLAEGYMDAIWYDASSILAAVAEPCEEGECMMGPWQSTGVVDIVDIETGDATRTALGHTMEIATLYGVASDPPPAEPETIDGPVFEPRADVSTHPLEHVAFDVEATDPTGGALTYAARDLPEGATFDAATRTFEWTPALDQEGTWVVTFTATDDRGRTAEQRVTITVGSILDVLRSL